MRPRVMPWPQFPALLTRRVIHLGLLPPWACNPFKAAEEQPLRKAARKCNYSSRRPIAVIEALDRKEATSPDGKENEPSDRAEKRLGEQCEPEVPEFAKLNFWLLESDYAAEGAPKSPGEDGKHDVRPQPMSGRAVPIGGNPREGCAREKEQQHQT